MRGSLLFINQLQSFADASKARSVDDGKSLKIKHDAIHSRKQSYEDYVAALQYAKETAMYRVSNSAGYLSIVLYPHTGTGSGSGTCSSASAVSIPISPATRALSSVMCVLLLLVFVREFVSEFVSVCE